MSGISVCSPLQHGAASTLHILYYVVHMTASYLVYGSVARCNIGVVDMQAYILFIFELLLHGYHLSLQPAAAPGR